MRVLVLGAGQMGSVIAKDLATNGYDVTVADIKEVQIDGVKSIVHDMYKSKMALFKNYGLVVCALPAKLGPSALGAALFTGVNFVDLSYTTENVLKFNDHAEVVGSIIIPDCGIAPGISNLVAGRAVYNGNNYVEVGVGGFAKDENAPLGYAVSWSVEDLMDEYIRPARIISSGEIKTVDALTGLETVNVPGVGDLDAFYTDGLRTLLHYRRDEISRRKCTVVEKTMRRAGHMNEMKELIKKGELQKYVEENCMGLVDMLVMRFDTGEKTVNLIVNGDSEMSAMARTTALSCSAFAQLVLENKIKESGVIPPEVLAEDPEIYKYLLDKLETHGVVFSEKYPFI